MAEPGTPAWWLDRLHRQLVVRRPAMDVLQRYADGDHDDPLVAERASRAFRRILGLSKTNLTGLVVEATAERLAVQGFRFGDNPDADADAWRIWQTSDFDADSETAIIAALTFGRAFVSVEPTDDGPRLYAEDPRQVIVAYQPGNRRIRTAALKEWTDDWTGQQQATLYLPERVYKFRQDPAGTVEVGASGDGTATRWTLRGPVESNPLGEVPFLELRNRARIDGEVMSEIEDILDTQDRANHIALNALIAAEYGAFRQKWATGLEIPRDPGTGLPVEPFDVAVNRILIAEDPESRFGDFNATDLDPYINLFESTVRHMAAVSRTPASYLLGQLANLSAEALAAAEAGLVKKAARRAKGYESAFEGAMRLAFRSMGDPRGFAVTAETVWANMEIKSWAQAADAAVKLTQAGVIPPQQAREDLGYSETQRQRMDAWAADADSLSALTATLEQQVNGFAPTANG